MKTNHLLSALNAELDDVYTMSEEAACFRYNVDNKQEIIDILTEQIKVLEAEADENDSNDEDGRVFHFAFPTETNFWRYKF